MARMLGTSRTWRWRLCTCQFCDGNRALFRYTKRSARRREERLWRREQDR